MSIPSYNKFVRSPGFDRYEPTNSFFDYYSPGTVFGGIEVTDQASYVIREEQVLTCQLAEMFNRNLPEIVCNGEYISKGIININKQHMYEYLHNYNKHLPIPQPKDANRYIGDIGVVNYIVWKFVNNLDIYTNGGGQILGYRLRYIFPPKLAMYPIKAITTILYKNLRDHIICYSYWINPDPEGSNAIDVIISNAVFHRPKNKSSRTISSYMNYITRRINSDINHITITHYR